MKNTHWWLKNKETLDIIDPTKEQFESNYEELFKAYNFGRGNGFLTNSPSKRCLFVLEKFNEIYYKTKINKINKNKI